MNKRKLSEDADESSIKIRKVGHEGKLDFFKAPVSLKDMATIKITIAVWYHQNFCSSLATNSFIGSPYHQPTEESYIHNCRDSANDYGVYDYSRLELKVSNAIKKLPIPPKLLPCFNSNVDLIRRQLKNWFRYHKWRVLFPSEFSDTANILINEIVWRSDGYIDYMATAKNLLKSPLLSDIYKFRVMCIYCLEDEIVQFPDYIISPKYLNRVTFENHPLIFYWNCYLKKELDKIDLGEAASIENYMINKVDNWAAIEYFFDQLSVDDQVVKATVLIRTQGLRYQSRVLSKLNESQQLRVFMDCAQKILMNYIDQPSSKPFIFDLWNRCKTLITKKEFFDLFEEAVKSISYEECNDLQYIVSLLVEMWATAPTELKTNTESLNFQNIFRRFVEDCASMNIELLELFFEMLSGASDDHKIWVLSYGIHNFFNYLLKNFHPQYLDRLLKIICRNAEVASGQKKSFVDSKGCKNYCSILIKEGNSTKLSDIITTLVPDTERISYKMKILESESVMDYFITNLCKYECENLKKIVDDEVISLPSADVIGYKLKLLESKEMTDFCISELLTDQCKKLREFIDDVFGSDQNAANNFVLRICTMKEAVEKFREKINAAEFNRVKNFLEQFITREEDLETMKNKLLQSYLKIIRRGEFTIFKNVEWENFLTWCSTDLKQFKKSLVVEELFNKMLIKSVFINFDSQLRSCSFKGKCSFSELDAFLAWYFDTPQEIKEYKLDKIFNFRRMEMIDLLLKKTEKYHLRSVLTWFFEKDYDEIEKFRVSHAKNKISQFI